jgi:hypothetical protein
MFDLFFRPYVPGFRVKPRDEVPGFDIDENGVSRREGAWFNAASPQSTWSQYLDRAPTLTGDTIEFPTPGPSNSFQPSPSVGLVAPQDDMVGFRVGQRRAVPGNIAEEDIAWRESPWFGGMRPAFTMPQNPGSAQALTSTPDGPVKGLYAYTGAPSSNEIHPESVQPADGSLGGVSRVADDREVAFAKCHVRCVAQTVGRGLGPEAPQQYRRCMRECMAQSGHFDY